MSDQNPKAVLSDESRRRAQAREQTCLYTVGSERRHELLFAPYGISFSVFRALSYLLVRYPEGAAPSQIADDLLILRQSMTNIIDGLEKQGMVERVADPHDRRRIQIRLLPPGIELGQKLLEVEEDYSRRLRAYMGEENMEAYHRLEEMMYEAKVRSLDQILSERK